MSKKLAILTHLKIAVMDVNFIQVDDSGEDKWFKSYVEQMDVTSNLNPQVQALPNVMVRFERKFQTI
jgi:hypothetical protein